MHIEHPSTLTASLLMRGLRDLNRHSETRVSLESIEDIDLSSTTASGLTLLNVASRQGSLIWCQTLIEQGADPHELNMHGLKSSAYACAHPELLAFFIHRKCLPVDSGTPLEKKQLGFCIARCVEAHAPRSFQMLLSLSHDGLSPLADHQGKLLGYDLLESLRKQPDTCLGPWLEILKDFGFHPIEKGHWDQNILRLGGTLATFLEEPEKVNLIGIILAIMEDRPRPENNPRGKATYLASGAPRLFALAGSSARRWSEIADFAASTQADIDSCALVERTAFFNGGATHSDTAHMNLLSWLFALRDLEGLRAFASHGLARRVRQDDPAIAEAAFYDGKVYFFDCIEQIRRHSPTSSVTSWLAAATACGANIFKEGLWSRKFNYQLSINPTPSTMEKQLYSFDDAPRLFSWAATITSEQLGEFLAYARALEQPINPWTNASYADINPSTSMPSTRIRRESEQTRLNLLHWLVIHCNNAAVKTLVDAGADPNEATSGGSTPLALALLHRSEAIASTLLDAGAQFYSAHEISSGKSIELWDYAGTKDSWAHGLFPRIVSNHEKAALRLTPSATAVFAKHSNRL